jgi:hypothetical protein
MISTVSVYLTLAVIIIWQSSILMVRKGNIKYFLPFLLFGFLFSFKSAFIFYDLMSENTLMIFRSLDFTLLIWSLWALNKIVTKR